MHTFLEEIATHITTKYKDPSLVTIVLPSKRAGSFLKNYLRLQANKNYFSPTIISIEEFIETLSGLKIISNTALVFKSYEAYKVASSGKEIDDFEAYISWVTTLLNDFNEIDRHLVDPKLFFNYLNSIKAIERWNITDEPTDVIKNYLAFWDTLFNFYSTLKENLKEEGLGYQGMVYKEAWENTQNYINVSKKSPHIFIGFNALNKAEQSIIKEFLGFGYSEIFWDIDTTLLNDNAHATSYFIRNYLNTWNYFSDKKITTSNYFQKEKKIHNIEVQKTIGQAKYVSQILAGFSKEKLNTTAVVLADENLLIPLLYSLPENIGEVNITMGVSLKNFPITTFFELLVSLKAKKSKQLYFKDVLGILNHATCNLIFEEAPAISSKIITDNKTYFDTTYLYTIEALSEKSKAVIELLFENWKNSPIALVNIKKLIFLIKDSIVDAKIDLTVLYGLYNVILEIELLNKDYTYLDSLKTLQKLFTEHIAIATIDFKGSAYSGLQIMGILETRVLDFSTIIMTSVNEGILPSGKSNASFITYDLKKQFELPSYTEKDAIYAYHFYRLLQRATDVYLLYNGFSEGINTGEKSRFIVQLEIDKQPSHSLEKITLSPEIKIEEKSLTTIPKTKKLQKQLIDIAVAGFSPSALTSYIRNPLDFYYQKVLHIDTVSEVEETVASNTLGTIVHESLEELYKPYIGEILTQESLEKVVKKIPQEVTNQFTKIYKGGTINKGKNLLIFEVAKRYIQNFINYEILEIKKGNTIIIKALEQKLIAPISIPELPHQVNLKGVVDRIDTYNGILRIIDYKTGAVSQGDLEIFDWSLLTTDYKYSKAFQVLTYAYMLHHHQETIEAQAGIISFKNMQSGFLKFATKEKPRSTHKNYLISEEMLSLFKDEATKLILEICNPNIPIVEKEVG